MSEKKLSGYLDIFYKGRYHENIEMFIILAYRVKYKGGYYLNS